MIRGHSGLGRDRDRKQRYIYRPPLWRRSERQVKNNARCSALLILQNQADPILSLTIVTVSTLDILTLAEDDSTGVPIFLTCIVLRAPFGGLIHIRATTVRSP